MDERKALQIIRKWEEELLFAEPKRAAKLASKIVKRKAKLSLEL